MIIVAACRHDAQAWSTEGETHAGFSSLVARPKREAVKVRDP